MPTMTESHAGKAVAHLKKLGLRLPSKRFTKVELPQNLSDLSSRQLTDLMNHFSAYLAYVKSRLALASVWSVDHEDRYHKSFAVLLVQMKDDNPESTITALREEIKIKLETQNEKVLVAKAKVTLLTAVHDGADQAYTVLSRELTRRTSSFDRNVDT